MTAHHHGSEQDRHPHQHPHEHPHVPMNGAVLDIGGEIGAVLVRTGPDLVGAEIELYDEDGSYLMHTEVHARPVPGAVQYAGLFPAVPQGSYLLDLRDDSARERVVVTGGRVLTVEHHGAGTGTGAAAAVAVATG